MSELMGMHPKVYDDFNAKKDSSCLSPATGIPLHFFFKRTFVEEFKSPLLIVQDFYCKPDVLLSRLN